MARRTDIFSMWTGGPLGSLEIAVIKSWIALDYNFFLYTDDLSRAVPEGCQLRSLSEIIPPQAMKGRAPNAIADEFRYRLLQAVEGAIWVDMDAIGWKRLPDSPYLFAYESNHIINIGILRLPSSCPVLQTMLKRTRNPRLEVFRGMNWKEIFSFFLDPRNVMRLFKRQPFIAQIISGPRPFTTALKRADLTKHALPISAFYPIHFSASKLFFETGNADFVDSFSIHLWASSRQIASEGILPGSRIDQILSAVESRYQNWLRRAA